jgi:hypothetical protein
MGLFLLLFHFNRELINKECKTKQQQKMPSPKLIKRNYSFVYKEKKIFYFI